MANAFADSRGSNVDAQGLGQPMMSRHYMLLAAFPVHPEPSIGDLRHASPAPRRCESRRYKGGDARSHRSHIQSEGVDQPQPRSRRLAEFHCFGLRDDHYQFAKPLLILRRNLDPSDICPKGRFPSYSDLRIIRCERI
jgi:hypothetical protein